MMTLNLINTASDLDGTKADVIAGLTPTSDDGADLMVTKLSDAGIINGEEFTVFIGRKGDDKSWIEFGMNEDPKDNVTYLPLSNIPGTNHLIYWSTEFSSLTVGNIKADLSTGMTIWDTGTSLMGLNNENLLEFALTIANGRTLVNIRDVFYGVK